MLAWRKGMLRHCTFPSVRILFSAISRLLGRRIPERQGCVKGESAANFLDNPSFQASRLGLRGRLEILLGLTRELAMSRKVLKGNHRWNTP
ncbi:hypothetical protein C8Q78DRAFT_346970 [Trametes maxima]|nr:hypothetical protein C8Q78DRAFT_346970 [Trametes maxima]